ncbi:hypothetical protein ACFFGH_26895 [Lysobacter korlensis]|uniref:Uncharacterized protein n=1 Tax=Lysobacter korlensis TaxID=553636 RepID=A0ABV6S002_9GAMM
MEQERVTEPKPGEVILRVSLRPGWQQWIPEPLYSDEVTNRMAKYARLALQQFKNADHVVVTVVDEHGEVRELLQARTDSEQLGPVVPMAEYILLRMQYEAMAQRVLELELVLDSLGVKEHRIAPRTTTQGPE